MTTVYVVTDGVYSDYSILGIYSSREKAEYAKMVYDAGNEIKEWILDKLPPHTPGMLFWRVGIGRDGANVSRTSPGVRPGIDTATKGYRPPDSLYFYIEARDEAHAIKIVSEYRARILADEGLWDEIMRQGDYKRAIQWRELVAREDAVAADVYLSEAQRTSLQSLDDMTL